MLELLPTSSEDEKMRVDAARRIFAERHEMAIEPRDFLEVSTSLGLEGQPVAA